VKTRILKREPQGVLSIETGFALLLHIANSGLAMTVAEVAGAAGFTPAKTHRYLVSFEQSGFVVSHSHGRYELGPSAVLTGLAAQHRMDEFRLVENALSQLQKRTGATASAVVWGNHGPTIIRRMESSRAVTVTTRVGSVIPITRSSSGIVFAAFLSPALVAPYIEQELAVLAVGPRKAAITRASFVQKVADTRRQGVAVIEGDFVAGVNAIAAPVFGPDGGIWVSLAILGPHGSFDMSVGGLPRTTLLEVTRALSARVGAQLQD
jgi:DNA-binding IclR family transcriptional regulator